MRYSFMAIPKRLSVIITLIGEKKTGKTVLTEDLVDKMVNLQGKPTIIFDAQNQYTNIPVIAISEIKNWGRNINRLQVEKPIVRIVLDKTKYNTRPKELQVFAEFCNAITQHVGDSCIVFEDLLSFIKNVVPQCLSAVLLKNRIVGNEIVLNIHSFKETPPEVFMRTDVFYVKYTKDIRITEKALYPNEFNAIRKILEQDNAKIINLKENEHCIQWATVEFIADLSLRNQLLQTGVPFNQF